MSEPADAAWIALLPCAALTAAIVYLLGPVVAGLLDPGDNPFLFWEFQQFMVRPEYTEQARYLLLLGGPVLLVAATTGLVLRRWPVPVWAPTAGPVFAQAATGLFLAVCLAAQYRFVYGETWSMQPGVSHHLRYFKPATLVVAVVAAALVAVAATHPMVRQRLAAIARPRRVTSVLCLCFAATATALWMVQGVNSDRSVATAVDGLTYHLQFTADETFAVIDGLTPLVDFTAQYGSLWPLLVAVPTHLFGDSLLAFTITMSTITAISLFAVYDVLRRVTENALGALLLFVPFLATSLFLLSGTPANGYSDGSYFAVFPLRYAGPYLLAWLLVRRLQREPGRYDALLFAAAGLVMLNNVDFGVPAFGATVAAILWTSGRPSRGALLRLLRDVAIGLAIAIALVSAVTLLRAGSLPHFGRLVAYARQYTTGGFAMLPLPGALGLHTIIYATFVGAIGAATVRVLTGREGKPLTGMLVWSGVFGLGAGAYFVGRSHPEQLVASFSIWALAIALLTVVAIRELGDRERVSIAPLLVLFGLGLSICSVAQVPPPWQQAERLRGEIVAPDRFVRNDSAPLAPKPSTRLFFSSTSSGGKMFVKEGAPVANLIDGGHRVSAAFGVRNVARYTGSSVVGPDMLRTVIEDLRAAGGTTLFIANVQQEQADMLLAEGFEPLTTRGFGVPRAGADFTLAGPLWTGLKVSKWRDTYRSVPPYLKQDRGQPVPLVFR